MNRFALFSAITGTLVAQGVCADGEEPTYDDATITRLWLGDGHSIHGNHCLVGGVVTERTFWATAPVQIEGAAGAVALTGLPAGAHIRIDPDGMTEFERAYAQANGAGACTITLPAGQFRVALEGAWKGQFAQISLT